ncbi:hypothetical protein B296_00056468 [Ensete ventricosum]|uniref:Uncharacterized protein n=1 Tax=Ensete ventricosum TaxID=4639 RepID=A0A426XV68_ENSVE|nr:hypothetical protein B296_00056468 [Ensete ventricosum]
MLVGDWTGRALLFGSWTGRALLLGNWASCVLLLGDWTGRRTKRWLGSHFPCSHFQPCSSASSDLFSLDRPAPSVDFLSRVASLESLEASTSETLSGVPSSTDIKALRDLEVMRVCHDFDSIVTEGSLAAIRKHYSIEEEYAMHALLPEQRP